MGKFPKTKLGTFLSGYFLRRKLGIIGVPFGRTELSLRLSSTELCALLRREHTEAPGVQGVPGKRIFMIFDGLNNHETKN